MVPICDYCGATFVLGDGIYDDGDFMCGNCITNFTTQFEVTQVSSRAIDIGKRADSNRSNSNKQLKSNIADKNKKLRNQQTPSQLNSDKAKEETFTGKPDKASRLAKNIQIMLRATTPHTLHINPSNEKAFYAAIRKLGMNLDEFQIEHDGCYLDIRLKRDYKTKSNYATLPLLKRPNLPKLDAP
jgi:hypothetical protein